MRNGVKYDYCFVESITALCNNCDQVSVVVIETDDDTAKECLSLSGKFKNLSVVVMGNQVWDTAVYGKEKLAHFQNVAASALTTDYVYLQQADEVTCDRSWEHIRAAIEKGGQGYLATRVNLWATPNTMLAVSQNRKPCSTEVLRLAIRGSYTYGDGESIASSEASTEFIADIQIMHYGFVRKKEVHPEKIRQMQRDIFRMTPDPKLEGMENFEPERWFSQSDLALIAEEHPKVMRDWVKVRP